MQFEKARYFLPFFSSRHFCLLLRRRYFSRELTCSQVSELKQRRRKRRLVKKMLFKNMKRVFWDERGVKSKDKIILFFPQTHPPPPPHPEKPLWHSVTCVQHFGTSLLVLTNSHFNQVNVTPILLKGENRSPFETFPLS